MKIVWASGRKHETCAEWDVVFSTGHHLKGGTVRHRDEEYWRARIVTGMTQQLDPFFYRDSYMSNNYGRRP